MRDGVQASDEERVYLVTGADSGLGRAVAARLARTARVITCGIGTDVDIHADLSSAIDRRHLVERAHDLSSGRIDGVVLAAGIGNPAPATVSVNFFGITEVLDGLRPCLARSSTPSAVVISSSSTLNRGSGSLVRACLSGDEQRARAVAQRLVRWRLGSRIYRSSKQAINAWVRRTAIREEWARPGITLNAVAPGIIATDTVMRTWAQDEELLEASLPQPLGAPGEVQPVAELVAFLASAHNQFMTGQVVYCDGGSDALLRGTRPQRVFLRYRPRQLRTIIRAAGRRAKAAVQDEEKGAKADG